MFEQITQSNYKLKENLNEQDVYYTRQGISADVRIPL